MARHQHYPQLPRSVESLADASDLRAAITEALAVPRDERALRQAVWTYVGTEREAGASPGRVILTLTELLEAAAIEPGQREPLMREVILWCVEAYFGHLGGDVFRESRDDAAQPLAEGGR
jgi:hypothetical protein